MWYGKILKYKPVSTDEPARTVTNSTTYLPVTFSYVQYVLYGLDT